MSGMNLPPSLLTAWVHLQYVRFQSGLLILLAKSPVIGCRPAGEHLRGRRAQQPSAEVLTGRIV
jgi:hypothetical protein